MQRWSLLKLFSPTQTTTTTTPRPPPTQPKTAHLARRPAHVAEVGIGHLTGPVDDAAHHGYGHAFSIFLWG